LQQTRLYLSYIGTISPHCGEWRRIHDEEKEHLAILFSHQSDYNHKSRTDDDFILFFQNHYLLFQNENLITFLRTTILPISSDPFFYAPRYLSGNHLGTDSPSLPNKNKYMSISFYLPYIEKFLLIKNKEENHKIDFTKKSDLINFLQDSTKRLDENYVQELKKQQNNNPFLSKRIDNAKLLIYNKMIHQSEDEESKRKWGDFFKVFITKEGINKKLLDNNLIDRSFLQIDFLPFLDKDLKEIHTYFGVKTNEDAYYTLINYSLETKNWFLLIDLLNSMPIQTDRKKYQEKIINIFAEKTVKIEDFCSEIIKINFKWYQGFDQIRTILNLIISFPNCKTFIFKEIENNNIDTQTQKLIKSLINIIENINTQKTFIIPEDLNQNKTEEQEFLEKMIIEYILEISKNDSLYGHNISYREALQVYQDEKTRNKFNVAHYNWSDNDDNSAYLDLFLLPFFLSQLLSYKINHKDRGYFLLFLLKKNG
jgi:hypothetical protein